MPTLARASVSCSLLVVACALGSTACTVLDVGYPNRGRSHFPISPPIVVEPETCRSTDPNVAVEVRAIRPIGRSLFVDDSQRSVGRAVQVSLRGERDGTLRANIASLDGSSGIWVTVSIRRTANGVDVTPQLWKYDGTFGADPSPLGDLRGSVTIPPGGWTENRDPILLDVDLTGKAADETTYRVRAEARVGTLVDG